MSKVYTLYAVCRNLPHIRGLHHQAVVHALEKLMGANGFEPLTDCVLNSCTTVVLRAHDVCRYRGVIAASCSSVLVRLHSKVVLIFYKLVMGPARFELTTTWIQARDATKLHLSPRYARSDLHRAPQLHRPVRRYQRFEHMRTERIERPLTVLETVRLPLSLRPRVLNHTRIERVSRS